MKKLNCTAVTCMYNNEMACEKKLINVGGKELGKKNTRCQDYKSFGASIGDYEMARDFTEPDHEKTDIKCVAGSCKHNHACDCHADKVDIIDNSAHEYGRTSCGTYENRQ